VILKVEVLPNGHVGRIELKKSSGHESLDRSALHAVRQWRFFPGKEGEETVTSWVNVPIHFKLR
jgi:protein TonB